VKPLPIYLSIADPGHLSTVIALSARPLGETLHFLLVTLLRIFVASIFAREANQNPHRVEFRAALSAFHFSGRFIDNVLHKQMAARHCFWNLVQHDDGALFRQRCLEPHRKLLHVVVIDFQNGLLR